MESLKDILDDILNTILYSFATKCLIYDIPKIINNCSAMITEQIKTYSFTGYSYYVKQT